MVWLRLCPSVWHRGYIREMAWAQQCSMAWVRALGKELLTRGQLANTATGAQVLCAAKHYYISFELQIHFTFISMLSIQYNEFAARLR